MFMVNINVCKLKGQARYFDWALGSIRRVIFSFICQIILSAQKVAVVYQSRDNVFLKTKEICPQSWIIVLQLNSRIGWKEMQYNFLRSNGFKERKICNNTGNMYGILCMCTSYRFTFYSVAGETWKFFLPC
jgi:hypothetical protein